MSACQIVAEFHRATVGFVSEVATPLPWSDQILLLCQARAEASPKQLKDVLPILACRALGGEGQRAIPVAAAWLLYTIGGRLIDDLQDGETSALAALLPEPEAAMNLALALLPLAQVCLARLDAPAELLRKIVFESGYMLAAIAHGQQQEQAQEGLPTEEAYFSALLKKTGNFGATAIWAGASLGQPSLVEKHLDHLYTYGVAVAIRAQLLDDCLDLAHDIGRRVFTLPVIAAAKNSGHASHPELQRMVANVTAQHNSADLAQLVHEMGGVQMTYTIADRYRIQAANALTSLPNSPAKECLLNYVSVE